MINEEKAVLKLLNKDKELFKRWKELKQKATEEGYVFTSDIAWIKFKELYAQTDDGEWIEI